MDTLVGDEFQGNFFVQEEKCKNEAVCVTKLA